MLHRVTTERRFSIVPTNPREVDAMTHAAKLLSTTQKTLVLAAMRRGLLEVALPLNRHLLTADPIDPEAVLACKTLGELEALVRAAARKSLQHQQAVDDTNVVGPEAKQIKPTPKARPKK